MKARLLMALAFGVGALLFELIKSGMGGVDWARVGFITVVMFLVSLLVPTKAFKFKRASSRLPGKSTRDVDA